MPFDITTRTLLEYYTNHPPRTVDIWYGPWNTILTTLFPSSKGYVVIPQRHKAEISQINKFDSFLEVAKLSTPPVTLRTVLIVEFKNSQYWDSTGKDALMKQVKIQTDTAFVGTAFGTVYWIGIIGPHWRYGDKKNDDEQDPNPLIGWHDVTHDNASYLDLKQLVDLVDRL